MEPPSYALPGDSLPGYLSSLDFFGVALLKTEFLTPYHYNSHKRGWKPVVLELNSTQLNVYALRVDKRLEDLICALFSQNNLLDDLCQNMTNDRKAKHLSMDDQSASSLLFDELDLFSGDAYGGDFVHDSFRSSTSAKLKSRLHKNKLERALSKTLPLLHQHVANNRMLFEPLKNGAAYEAFAVQYRGPLVHSYTLSNAKLGEAPSLNQLILALYKEDLLSQQQNVSTLVKYKNVLRLRIECQQVLLQFWLFHGMVQWFRNLSIGRDLSLPLESRAVTKLKSIPSRYSGRNNALLAATAAAASYSLGSEESGDENMFANTEICFNDPFPSEEKVAAPPSFNNCCYNPSNSVVSEEESVFSDRRGSVASNNTSIGSPEPVSVNKTDSCNRYAININGHRLVSFDRVYSTPEKQYISNCIPDLNSYDKWSGSRLTLSNFQQYLTTQQVEQLAKNKLDLLISHTHLTCYLGKRKKGLNSGLDLGECRLFLIHENGLVSVAPVL